MERNMRCSCGIGRVSLSGINSNYLKLLSAMIVALFLAVPYWKARYLDRPASKGGANHA